MPLSTSSVTTVAVRLARWALAGLVVLMAAWNAYICLRRTPDGPTVVVNLAFWIVPVAVACAASGRLWRGVAFGTAVTFAFQRLHWLKWRYLEHTWTVADFRFAADSTNWIVIQQYPEIAVFAALTIALLVATWTLTWVGPRLGVGARLTAAAVALAVASGVYVWRHAHEYDPFGHNLYGHFANLVYSSSTLEYHAPVVETDSRLFKTRAAAVPPAPLAVPPQPPDIVIWLQESTMDLGLFQVAGASLPAMPMYDPESRTIAQALLRVPTWGGATWLSEFALLAGLAPDDFGPSANSVYYTVTPKLQYSLPKLLKTRAGYRSVAISGSPKAFYNMEAAQRELGFDEVLNPLDFPEWRQKPLADHLISDEELGRYALQILHRPRTTPMLLFVLSIAQHGPYDPGHPVGHGLGAASLDPATRARLSDYADRMVATDAACRSFRDTLLSEGHPIVFAYFGDHQPNLEGAVPYQPALTAPQYLTSYAVTSNFAPDLPAPEAPELDLAFLSGLVLQVAGVPLDPFFTANRAMRELCGGRLDNCPDQALVKSYRAHQYDDLLAASRQ